MSKETQSEILIEGEKLEHFTSVNINQRFNAHHTFTLTVSQEVLEDQGEYTIQKSQQLIGKSITICFGEKSTADNTFKGIITEVAMQQEKGLWGTIILMGFSPTYLMEGGDHFASYYKKSLSTIVSKITSNLSAHDMRITIDPKYNSELAYTTQYRESSFVFLNRLASEYGEWFYYNGEELFFGKPDKTDNIELFYGATIENMTFSMNVMPTKVAHYSYNSKDDKTHKSNSPDRIDGSNNYIKQALQVSDSMFQQSVNQPTFNRTSDKQQLDEYAKKQKGVNAANTVRLKAHGDNPKVKLGCHVTVKVIQKEIKGIETPEHGEYLITSIIHDISGTGEYTHSFEAIPSDNNYIPVPVPITIAETQMAIVKQNNDPDNGGRVRVQMLWQEESGEMTDWIRVLTPDAGSSDKVSKNRGFVFIPEEGDQVLVGFRYNDPNRPFVLGSVFNGKTASGGDSGNKLKSITTRTGSTIVLDDDKESVTVSDPSGNTIVLNGDGTITITAPKKIEFSSKEITINGSDKVIIESKVIDAKADNKITLDAKEITATGTTKIVLSSKTKLELSGANTSIEGKAQLKIESKGIIDVDGTTMTNVKGGMLNLN